MKKSRAKKSCIVHYVKDNYFPELSVYTCTKLVEAVIAAMKAYLKSGIGITISNFGSFTIKERAARKARNVQTGEVLFLPPSKKIVFTPTPEIKKKLSSGGS